MKKIADRIKGGKCPVCKELNKYNGDEKINKCNAYFQGIHICSKCFRKLNKGDVSKRIIDKFNFYVKPRRSKMRSWLDNFI